MLCERVEKAVDILLALRDFVYGAVLEIAPDRFIFVARFQYCATYGPVRNLSAALIRCECSLPGSFRVAEAAGAC